MDAHGDLHPLHRLLDLQSVFHPPSTKPTRALLFNHELRVRADDHQNHSRAFDTPTIPVLDRHVSAPGWRSRVGESTQVRDEDGGAADGVVVFERVFGVRSGRVFQVGLVGDY